MNSRMAGTELVARGFLPPLDQFGEGCAKRPESWPPPVKPQMSHGPDLLGTMPVENYRTIS